MEWKTRNFCSMEEYIRSLGIEPSMLNESKYYPYDFYHGYTCLQKAIQSGNVIYIIGDYDVDGITSSTELNYIVALLGGKAIVRIPRRFSEGYGLSMKIIDEIPDGAYVVTVDNGISAIDEIKAGKQRGMKFMILDHHLPSTNENKQYILPEADVIYNPHIDHAVWKDYCAAGIVYKFAEYLFSSYQNIMNYFGILACIGTIADMVALLGDNRNIVKYGIGLINTKCVNMPIAVKLLLEEAGLTFVTATDIAFRVAPMINAPGRMLDDGSQMTTEFFMNSDEEKGIETVFEIKRLNEERKKLDNEIKSILINHIDNNKLHKKGHPLCVYKDGIPEGLIGLIAGSLASKYHTAVFVLTNVPDTDDIKGSARGNGCMHIKNTLMKNQDILIKGGGHEGAGGFSLKRSNLDAFINRITNENIEESADVLESAFSINQKDISKWYEQKSLYEPYGQGIPEPLFYINSFESVPRYSKFAEFVGTAPEGSDIKPTVRIYGKDVDAIGFNMSKDYLSLGSPKRLDLVGKIVMNYFNEKQQIKFQIEDMKKTQVKTGMSKEAAILFAAAGK